MSAGDLALIACIPGLGLMLLAAEASQKNQRARLGFDKENDSEHGARFSSSHDSPELRCSSTSKQQTLQDSNRYMAGMESARAVPSTPAGSEWALHTLASPDLRHRGPQNVAGASSKALAATAGLLLLCHGKAPCHLPGRQS